MYFTSVCFYFLFLRLCRRRRPPPLPIPVTKDRSVAHVTNQKSNDKQKITNEFCKFFSTVGKKCAESIPSANKSPEQYIKSVPNKTSIYLNPTSPDEIEKIINSLKSKKSSGVME